MRTRTAPQDYDRTHEPDMILDKVCARCGRPTTMDLCYRCFVQELDEQKALLELDALVKDMVLNADPEGVPADMKDEGYEVGMQTRASLGI
jgi:hypothetical protein